jgi:hypothetical protein
MTERRSFSLRSARLPKDHPAVRYRAAADDAGLCAACVYYQASASCNLVEGLIGPAMTCDLFRARADFLPPEDALPDDDLYASEHRRLYIELATFAEPPEWIPVLPVPGRYRHPAYGTVVITRERNARFVANFQAGVYQDRLPVDAEHRLDLGGAYGWIVALRQNADGSVDGQVEWTDRGRAAIARDRFRYISPAWYDRWTDPLTQTEYEDVLIGAALTVRPFFKPGALRPLVARASGLYAAAATLPEGAPDDLVLERFHEERARVRGPITTTERSTPMADETTRTAQAEPQAPASEPNQTTVTVAMSEELRQQFAELQARLAEITAERDALREANEQRDAALQQATERIAALEREARLVRFRERAAGWFGETEQHVRLLEDLVSAFGEDGEPVTTYMAQQDALAEQLRASRLFAEIGSHQPGRDTAHGEAWAKIEALARQYLEHDPSLTYAQAIARVHEREPELVKAYREERARA